MPTQSSPLSTSARLSAPCRGALLRTPPGGPHHPGDGAALPQLPSFDAGSHLRLERLHSDRRTGSRGEEMTTPSLDSEQVAAAAAAMSREELENAVKMLDTENRMLKNSVLREREELVKLQEGLWGSYEAAEKEGENITNQLTRRVDAVRQQKNKLEAQLRKEETMKAEQEQRLFKLKTSSNKLSQRLQQEEEETLTALANQLQQLQAQRQKYETLLSEQSSSLHQLQELVDSFQTHTGGGHNSGPSLRDDECSEKEESSHHTAADTKMSGDSFSFSVSHEYGDAASDPKEMLQYLYHEVSFLEGLQREESERAERYEKKRHELEQRIAQAELERRRSHYSLKGIHQELVETTTTVSELASAAEMAMEATLDRQIHARSRACSIHSASREAETPGRSSRSPRDECIRSAECRSRLSSSSK